MTRKTPAKTVGDEQWRGRLDNARAVHQAARDAVTLAEPNDNVNPILSSIVNAAIAYADALTGKTKHMVNRKDHGTLTTILRNALGNRLPAAELARVNRLLAAKKAAQCGARRGRLETARHRLEDLDALAQWAEVELSR